MNISDQGNKSRSVGTFNSKIINASYQSSSTSNVSGNSNYQYTAPITYAERQKMEAKRIAQVENLPELQMISSVISLATEETIQRISVVDIVNPDISTPRYPQSKSLYDTNMGAIVPDRKCSTCQNITCLGHFGRIAFASPIPHPMWLSVIKDILTSVCGSCGSLLVAKNIIIQYGLGHMSPQKRINAIAGEAVKINECRNYKKCPDIANGVVSECQRNPIYTNSKQDESFQIKTEIKQGRGIPPIKGIISVDKILSIFKCISKEDSILLGFHYDSRPEALIMQSLMVIPPVSRLPFATEDNRINPNDLTEAYRQIVICANELKLKPTDDRIRTNLYFKVKVLIEGKKQKYKNVKVFMSITNHLQGKQGVPRSNMMGKRTNMCARTVISPDTSLNFRQIRIPMEWASILTIKETVTRFNLKAMRNLSEQGKIADIQSSFKERGTLRKGTSGNFIINVGDTVTRHLRNGDIIVLNRQPTLHKFGMMAFEVILGKDRTIGLHMSYTTTFNADFDGDEMNIWVPQGINAITEARELIHVTKNVMSPAKNKINMGLVYDAITASFLLTRQKIVDEGLYLELKELVSNNNDLASLDKRLARHNVPPRSGRGVFSLVLPERLNYFHGNVIILNGVLINGTLTDENVGPSSKSIVEKIYMEFGSSRYAEFLTNASFLILKYISERGHTVGITDCMSIDKGMRDREFEENEKAFEIIQAKVDALPKMSDNDEISLQLYENSIKDIVRSASEMGFSLIKNNISDIENNIGVMLSKIGGGAKGKVFNIHQIRGRLGQQFKKGERLSCGSRILPGFDENDPDIRARGFIKSNFVNGLTPEEFFLHMMASREGLIDTAVNVAIMGDIHRRIVKALENLFIGYNGSVTNSNRANFQLLLGGDGFDPARLIRTKRAGNDGNLLPSFVDIHDLVKDLNAESGWITKKDFKMTAYSKYIIEIEFRWLLKGHQIEVSNVNTSEIVNYLQNYFGDELLQQIIVIPESAPSEKNGLKHRAKFYYKTSEDGNDDYGTYKDKHEIESKYQLDYFENMKNSEIIIRSESPIITLVITSVIIV